MEGLDGRQVAALTGYMYPLRVQTVLHAGVLTIDLISLIVILQQGLLEQITGVLSGAGSCVLLAITMRKEVVINALHGSTMPVPVAAAEQNPLQNPRTAPNI